MKGKVLLLICLVVVLVLAAATSAFAVPSMKVYKADLVELNGSGVTGTAVLTIMPTGNLKVRITAYGLVPCKIHRQNLHGFKNGDPATIPMPDISPYSDGIVSYEEALAYTGPILLALENYPRADETGFVEFTRVYIASKGKIDDLDLAKVSLADRVVMLQGGYLPSIYSMDVYDRTLPVAAGDFEGPIR